METTCFGQQMKSDLVSNRREIGEEGELERGAVFFIF